MRYIKNSPWAVTASGTGRK